MIDDSRVGHRFGDADPEGDGARAGSCFIDRRTPHYRMAWRDDWDDVRPWGLAAAAFYGAILLVLLVAASMISWVDCLGLCAGAAVLMTFLMPTMNSLRAVALLSNVLFVTYGVAAHVYPVLILHAILFPINLAKLNDLYRSPSGKASDEASAPDPKDRFKQDKRKNSGQIPRALAEAGAQQAAKCARGAGRFLHALESREA